MCFIGLSLERWYLMTGLKLMYFWSCLERWSHYIFHLVCKLDTQKQIMLIKMAFATALISPWDVLRQKFPKKVDLVYLSTKQNYSYYSTLSQETKSLKEKFVVCRIIEVLNVVPGLTDCCWLVEIDCYFDKFLSCNP